MTIFQSQEWEQFKLATGYSKSYRVDGILVLQRSLALGQTMLYSPMISQNKILKIKDKKYFEKIQNIAKQNKAIFYRLEVAEPITDTLITDLQKLGFTKAISEIQPSHTRILNLMMTEDEILAQMKPKGRYNIKIAQRSNIKIEKINDLKRFYKLYQEMSKRHKLTHRSLDYFQKLFDILAPKGYIEAFIARQGNVDLAGALVAKYDGVATYLFGGSSEEMKNLMAPYLLHWEIIKQAKVEGYKSYDLFGVSPEGKPDHKWAGVTAFKEKFGGEYVELAGSWDLPLKPLAYKIFRLAEKNRNTN